MTDEHPTLDNDGYPTEETLKVLREWPYNDLLGLFDYVEILWYYPEYFTRLEHGRFLISTGGWSGNEDIIAALQNNTMFWILCWVSSKRGGHYEFELPKSYR